MKRALLIASSMHERLGIEADLELMTEVLSEYGFEHIESAPRPATRDAILGALTQLVEDTGPGDTVVIYYTGHGGLAQFDGELAGLAEPRRIWRYLVPEDPEHHSAQEHRFAGVLDVELGHIIGEQLARKCDNVTVILECCFAGGMLAPPNVRLERQAQSRGLVEVTPFAVPDTLRGPQPWSRPPLEILASAPTGQAPIIVAATSEVRKAYETRQDGSAADFTAALAAALRRYRERPITWGRLIDGVRREVQLHGKRTSQAPHVIGPRGRAVFGVTTSDVSREFEVLVGAKGELHLMAGSLHGLHDGDELELLASNEDAALGVARARQLQPARAHLELAGGPLDPHRTPGESLVAILRAGAEPTPVALHGHGPTMTELRQALAASPWVRACDDPRASAYAVSCEDGRLRIEGGGLKRRPIPGSPGEDLAAESPVPWVVADLEALARARDFIRVCAQAAPPPPQIQFSLFAGGDPVEHEGVVRLDQTIRLGMTYVERYSGETLFLNVVNIGLDGRPYLLNGPYNHGGINLHSENPDRHSEDLDHVFGQSRTLTWPSEVPIEPTSESLYFVLTSSMLDLNALGRMDPDAEREPAPSSRGPKVLERLSKPVKLYVQRLDFTLNP